MATPLLSSKSDVVTWLKANPGHRVILVKDDLGYIELAQKLGGPRCARLSPAAIDEIIFTPEPELAEDEEYCSCFQLAAAIA